MSPAALISTVCAMFPTSADVRWEKLVLEDGPALEYALVLPSDHDPAVSRPLLLALPPGDQTRAMVERGLELYWRAEAERRGWIVASPVAPEDAPLFAGAEGALDALLDHLAGVLAVESGRVHLAGPSNGGRAALRYALRRPERLASLTVLPGALSGEDGELLGRLAELPVRLVVGALDEPWLAPARALEERLEGLGAADVRLTVVPAAGHRLPAAVAEGLFEDLEAFRARALDEARVRAALDDFHAAASEPDGERYFAHFAPGAVFMGTASEERWSVPEFRAYAEPFFGTGRGWTYHATERHVSVSGDVAWFDERLSNAKYGEARGSGVLRRIGGAWRIAQYNLALPVPNELAADLVERIRALGK